MGKGKDFFGKDIAEVIEQACRELGASREDLDIEVLETGSAGIFGLCKKKAHIRVQRKALSQEVEEKHNEPAPQKQKVAVKADTIEKVEPAAVNNDLQDQEEQKTKNATEQVVAAAPEVVSTQTQESDPEPSPEAEPPVNLEPPSAEGLAAIEADLRHLLELMGLPSEVKVHFEENTVQCHITGPHEEQVIGSEGRTLDSLQYLLRKMVSSHLPDRIMLALNAGDFRERRAEELKVRAVELAAKVKEDGKTQSIPALNPSERRVVHMILQEDKGVRSRSVGEGLFKKVLIYKPGKGRRSSSKKRRGGHGGRSSND
nr:Jag N-terminal domain-containing protein [uncultured Desulfobulbus sp.]